MGITEAERLPEAAAQLHEVFFGTTTDRLAAYLSGQYGLDAAERATLAAQLLGMSLYPTFARALFGIGELRDTVPDDASIETDVDMTTIRRATESGLSRRRNRNVAG